MPRKTTSSTIGATTEAPRKVSTRAHVERLCATITTSSCFGTCVRSTPSMRSTYAQPWSAPTYAADAEDDGQDRPAQRSRPRPHQPHLPERRLPRRRPRLQEAPHDDQDEPGGDHHGRHLEREDLAGLQRTADQVEGRQPGDEDREALQHAPRRPRRNARPAAALLALVPHRRPHLNVTWTLRVRGPSNSQK